MRTNISIDEAHGYGADEPVPNKARGHDAAVAAYDTAHGYEGGIAALAKRMGVNSNTLTHKVNPENTTHHLTLRDAIEMQWQSRNFSILHAMADELGHTCSLATPVYAEGDPLDTMVRLQMACADFMQALGEALLRREGGVSRNQMRKAEYAAAEVNAHVGHALGALRGLMRAEPKA
ncbi:phage regulatory CII family protein [Variovorax sp. RB3P1]|uniref:phage regulatory CII family protein n=1 Tax=Variovorax sp. RB3P1 TaxID=3443732 RepID=UPI003F44DCDA